MANGLPGHLLMVTTSVHSGMVVLEVEDVMLFVFFVDESVIRGDVLVVRWLYVVDADSSEVWVELYENDSGYVPLGEGVFRVVDTLTVCDDSKLILRVVESVEMKVVVAVSVGGSGIDAVVVCDGV